MANPYRVQRIQGLKPSALRAIAFLIHSDDEEIDALATFDALKEKRRREVMTRFDYWIDGGHQPKYFHGWNDTQYRHCFVFKWKERQLNHRLYGFLSHPTPVSAPRFELCTLASHGIKQAWETDPHELDGANKLRAERDVIAAIRNEFPDKEGKNG